MGKWTCQCGYPMNDHSAPDPNAFSIYSDELKAIADVLCVKFEQAFILPDGDEIKTSNEEV